MTAPQHDLAPWQRELVRLRRQAALPRPRCPGRPLPSRSAPLASGSGEGPKVEKSHQHQPRPEPLWQSALAVLGTVAILACLMIFTGGMER